MTVDNVIVTSKMQIQLSLGCEWARPEPDHTGEPFNRHITLITRDIAKSYTFLRVLCVCIMF